MNGNPCHLGLNFLSEVSIIRSVMILHNNLKYTSPQNKYTSIHTQPKHSPLDSQINLFSVAHELMFHYSHILIGLFTA